MKSIPVTNLVWRALAGAAAAAMLSLYSGCVVAAVGVAAGAGAGTVAYVRGDLSTTVGHHVGHVADAVDRTSDQMQLARINEVRDALSASITLRTADDTKVEIKLTRQSDDSTKIDIRAGTGMTSGDESLARTILEHIKSNL